MGDVKKYPFTEGCWDAGKVRMFLFIECMGMLFLPFTSKHMAEH